MKRIIKLQESQLIKIVENVIKNIDELDYTSFKENDDLQRLRDAIDNNITVSVAFVKKDGSVRHMSVRKYLSSYVASDREKSELQKNIEINNNIKRVIDINAYISKLKQLRGTMSDEQAKEMASKAAWRSINLENVLGFMARGEFIDLRDENKIMERFGEEIYGALTKSMKMAMIQDMPED